MHDCQVLPPISVKVINRQSCDIEHRQCDLCRRLREKARRAIQNDDGLMAALTDHQVVRAVAVQVADGQSRHGRIKVTEGPVKMPGPPIEEHLQVRIGNDQQVGLLVS